MNTLHLRQRGVGLFDGIAALAVLGFGLLSLTGFQGRLVAQSTEAQHRLVASQLADELLNTALIDSAGNTVCYVLPAPGGCSAASAAALAYTADWRARVLASGLPNVVDPTVATAASGRLTVTLSWRWTSKDGTTPAETRTHTVISDPR
ncbi:pilus assembly protein PilV [Aquabacterium sp.]|uniref:pilus assembly protein PilV n=1 Tax=Aquabacterium sp. TaxID=1872578 RepID=UPI002C1A5D3F|nr:pilus assembly protein PilV [Aquabacterium sp.]HSW07800.1 pilus assembly protein PilV [Aquabacterium sp.]